MSDDYKVCPECREEFTLVSTECHACGGVALVLPSELEADPTPESFPGVDALCCVRVGPLPWTRALSGALTEAGIAHRVEHDTRGEEQGGVDPRRFGGDSVYGTWVLPEALEAAREVDQIIFGHLEAESQEAAGSDETCPACQEPLAHDAIECPGCGLHLG